MVSWTDVGKVCEQRNETRYFILALPGITSVSTSVPITAMAK